MYFLEGVANKIDFSNCECVSQDNQPVTVTVHDISTHSRLSAQNVLKEATGPTAYTRRKVTEGSVSSSWRMFIVESMLRHIKKCTETEARRHGAENWSLALEELNALIALLYPRGKDEMRPEKEPFSENVVIRLMKPYFRTGRNVTTDNFFTSLKLEKRLSIEYCGHNKPYKKRNSSCIRLQRKSVIGEWHYSYDTNKKEQKCSEREAIPPHIDLSGITAESVFYRVETTRIIEEEKRASSKN
ncbi:hypothetical protein ILUMI_20577 [Ignelater luminosus]|uniref:PiggyBac transposable element-derived protein domain-containing protein n=1 Tax=Ignelater luminosus TaxID=2038154 RepID=A0A8K0CE14_IGNLU|nr:hypothetical protein ILUMI_20577 [Ignelater luminosus]